MLLVGTLLQLRLAACWTPISQALPMQHMRAFRPNKKKPVQFEALRAMEALEALEAWPGAKNSIIAFVETIDGCLMCKT